MGIPQSVSLNDSLASTSILDHVEKMTNGGVTPSSSSSTHEELNGPKRSKRARIVKYFERNFVVYNIEDEPVTFKDVMDSSKVKQWKEAVKSKMDSIVSNGTWILTMLKILEKLGNQDYTIAKTPYDPFVTLLKNESSVSVAQLSKSLTSNGVKSVLTRCKHCIPRDAQLSECSCLAATKK
ncbi:UNVERIFIED_CONTAM: hypothetical protein Scaly_1058800 [Sesamum calycinum]|uniref:Uncharacterized protein n=1 Tax=Sesamum calycinum TaxID=2727403 RepID=A0AAW2QKJ0_9LAMI